MANPEDFEKLCQGPKIWNAWRDEYPDIIPDLRDISLSLNQKQLGPSNGGPINLFEADLEGAELRHATLTGANLEHTNLVQADLVYARLEGANLKGADLTDAVLDYADLTEANLDQAILIGASLANARGLTQEQIAAAHGDATTLLPANVTPPESWFPPLDDDIINEYPIPESFYQTTLYEVLGVTSAATPDEIRSAFRNLVKRLHPDLNPGDDEAQEAFKRVSSAYRILSDPDKRRRYDRDEIDNDGEVNPEFEAKRQFRRYARRFYAAAAASLLFVFGVLGMVWYSVLFHEERGRVEIAVATPPKFAERLDPSLLAEPSPQPGNQSEAGLSAKPDSAADALTGAQSGGATAKTDLDSKPDAQSITMAEVKPAVPANTPAGDAQTSDKRTMQQEAANQSDRVNTSARFEGELGRASPIPPSNNLSEDNKAATPNTEARTDGGAAPAPETPQLPINAGADKAGAKVDEPKVANIEPANGPPNPGNLGMSEPAKTETGNSTPTPQPPSPSGTAATETDGAPPQPIDPRSAASPLGNPHSEGEARPAQADAARSDTPAAQQPVAQDHQEIPGEQSATQAPHGSRLLLQNIYRRGIEGDAISEMFAQNARRRGLAEDEAEATASIDALLSPDKPGVEDEIRDLYTHSIPSTGEITSLPSPKTPQAEQAAQETQSRAAQAAQSRALPHAAPAVPVARNATEKAPERDRTPPQATLRKQAVSDILAGGL